jgi:hypothetical protein
MEVNNAAHYNNNYHQAHAALVNLAMNNPLNGQTNGRISHGSPMVNDYARSSPALYGMSPAIIPGQQGSPLVSHNNHSPDMYNSAGQVGLDNYGGQSSGLGQQSASSYQNIPPYSNGLQSVFNTTLGASDPYQQQRGTFHY